MNLQISANFLADLADLHRRHGATQEQRDLMAHFIVGSCSVWLSTHAARSVLDGVSNEYRRMAGRKEEGVK